MYATLQAVLIPMIEILQQFSFLFYAELCPCLLLICRELELMNWW